MIKKYFFAVFTAMMLAVIAGGGVANAQTYTSIEAVEAAINAGTATKYTDILQLGTANGQTLEWIYMGPNQDQEDTTAGKRPYFVMTKDSFQTRLNISKWYHPNQNTAWLEWGDSQLYSWLNGEFKQNYLGNNQEIYEVTLPSRNDWTFYNNPTDIEQQSYISHWWLRTQYPYNQVQSWCISSGSGIASANVDNNDLKVRPSFYLKDNNLTTTIKFNGNTDAGDVTVSGSIAVLINCAGFDLTNSKYQWTTDENKPTENWINFQAPYTTVTTTQSVAATWYLHVSSTDILGRETYAKKKYIVQAAGSGTTTGLTLQDKQDIANLVFQASIQVQKLKVVAGKPFKEIVCGDLTGTTSGANITTTPTPIDTATSGTGYTVVEGTKDTFPTAGTYLVTITPTTGTTYKIVFNVIAPPITSTSATVSFSNP